MAPSVSLHDLMHWVFGNHQLLVHLFLLQNLEFLLSTQGTSERGIAVVVVSSISASVVASLFPDIFTENLFLASGPVGPVTSCV